MRVDAVADRGDPGAPRHGPAVDAHRRPRRRLGRKPERQPIEIDQRARPPWQPGRRERRVLERQRDAHQLRHARRGLAVPDRRLDRTDRVGARGARPIAEHLGQRGHLDRVRRLDAARGRLDVADRARIDPRARERGPDGGLLARLIGLAVVAHAAVVIDRAGADHRVDRIAVRARLREPLEHDDAHPLARHVARAALVERRAVRVAREHPHERELHIARRVQAQADAARDREIAVAPPQVFAGLVNGDERRRAMVVDRHARALQIEEVRHAADHRRGRRMRLGARILRRIQAEAVLRQPAEHARALAQRVAEAGRRVARILERLPALLEEQPLLRIDHRDAARRHPEEQRIETVELAEKAAPLAVRLAQPRRLLGIGVVMRAPVPALGRDFRDRVHAVDEVAPERGQIVGAGVAARHADDRDRIVVARPHRRA
ncbi:hypothetical protein DP42_6408 [Burkholderia pseudomallei]|nr:hypothetical protein DO73_6325 [Burkholderia pseudomallei]KGD32282.1 hypothetical protein DP42_6408 [Burkholderia pseudomallei]